MYWIRQCGNACENEQTTPLHLQNYGNSNNLILYEENCQVWSMHSQLFVLLINRMMKLSSGTCLSFLSMTRDYIYLRRFATARERQCRFVWNMLLVGYGGWATWLLYSDPFCERKQQSKIWFYMIDGFCLCHNRDWILSSFISKIHSNVGTKLLAFYFAAM